MRFDAFEQRHGGLEGQVGELRDGLAAARGELAETRAELAAARAELAAARAELAEARADLGDLRRLVEARVVAEAESTALVGKLLQRADARLEALERGGVPGSA